MADTSYHMTAFQRRRKLVFRIGLARTSCNFELWSFVCEVMWVGNQKHRPTENHKQMCVLSAQFFLSRILTCKNVSFQWNREWAARGRSVAAAPSGTWRPLSLSLPDTHWTRHTAWYTLDSGSRRVRLGTLPKCLQPHFVTLNTKLCNMHDFTLFAAQN